MIDQAYIEFGGTDLSRLVRERDDVVVVRTLSKAFALAGARVGYLLAPPAIARKLEAIRPPGSISSFSDALAVRALTEDRGLMEADVAETVAERERMRLGAVAAWAGRSRRRRRTSCSPTWESRSSRGSRAC